jgi:hypothetical protein
MAIHEPECVALKRRGAMHVAKLLAGKSPSEQLTFWQQRTERLIAHSKLHQRPIASKGKALI